MCACLVPLRAVMHMMCRAVFTHGGSGIVWSILRMLISCGKFICFCGEIPVVESVTHVISLGAVLSNY